jgi:hypothetical protein
MNAKEQIIELIKNKIFSTDEMELQKALITAVENAIFDVPSEEEIEKAMPKFCGIIYENGFKAGINYILNYKKPLKPENYE